ncbi:MAG: galactose-1-phosphate uridylyltransferase, partial [Burkholderiales bacterium]
VFDLCNGVGAHEVIIETPDHHRQMTDLTLDELTQVITAYKYRSMDLRGDRRLKYTLLFKNFGLSAGASLEHAHSQLIALPIVPKRVREEVDGSKQYFTLKERCIYCDIIRQELDAKTRVVDQNNDFVILEPYAPRFPFETWILPKAHESSFEEGQSHSYENLAKILKVLLTRMDKVLVSPAYNLVIHTAPLMEPSNDYYHWHFEMMPRLTRVAGFEWGTGFYINPTPPEEAAQFLRDA